PEPSKNLSVINKANEVPENREKEPDIFHQLYSTKISNTEVDNDNQITLDNMIKNGNFKNASNNWSSYMDRFTNIEYIENGVRAQAGANLSRFHHTADFNTEDIYYIKADILSNTNNGISIGTQARPLSNYTATNEKQLVSYVGKVEYRIMSLIISNTNDTASFFDAMAINLTETFGAGNEPSKEYMDNII